MSTMDESILSTRIIVNNLNDRAQQFEEEDRKKTLLMDGFPENQREDLRRICDMLFKDLGLPYGNERIDSVYRLGRFDPDKERPWTIVIKLSNRYS